MACPLIHRSTLEIPILSGPCFDSILVGIVFCDYLKPHLQGDLKSFLSVHRVRIFLLILKEVLDEDYLFHHIHRVLSAHI